MRDYELESPNCRRYTIPWNDSRDDTDKKVNMVVNCCMNKNDDKHDSCCNNQIAEFQYDEKRASSSVPTSTIQVLEVGFSVINPGDRVWLSGVINLNSSSTDVSLIEMSIQRVSPGIDKPETVYFVELEIDKEGQDDLVLAPFSHVDVPNTRLFDVKYQVILSADRIGVSLNESSTLTAVRFSR